MFSGISGGFLLFDLPFVPQVGLIPHEEYYNVIVSLLLEGLEPLRDVLETVHVRDVVDKEGTHCPTVVGRCDRTIALLACGVPYLSLNVLSILSCDLLGGKLHPDGCL
jgi:hypothetical protein